MLPPDAAPTPGALSAQANLHGISAELASINLQLLSLICEADTGGDNLHLATLRRLEILQLIAATQRSAQRLGQLVAGPAAGPDR